MVAVYLARLLAINGLKKSLLVRDLLLIPLIQLSQKHKNKRNSFDSFTNSK